MFYPKVRAKGKCPKCNELLKGHMKKNGQICPSEHGHKLTGDNRYTCSHAACGKTYTNLYVAHKHSTTSCSKIIGPIIEFPCPNNCGTWFRTKNNALTHSKSTACSENPERKANPEYRTQVSHAIKDNKTYCSDCKQNKDISEFGFSKSSDTNISHICKRCYGIRAKYSGCLQRAKKEGKIPDFTLKDIKTMVNETVNCPVFGYPLQYSGDKFCRQSGTIDAFIHSDGHKKTNLRIISSFANTIKNNSDVSQMKQLIDALESWTPPDITEIPKNKRVHTVLSKGQKSKICSVCRTDKPLDQYSKDPKNTLGVSCRCFRCSAIKAMSSNARKRITDPSLFTITLEYIHALAKGVDVCPILKIPLQYANGKLCDSSATLDKLDPSKGYVPGNVWIISDKANRMKSDATLEEITKVYEYMSG